MDKKTIVLIVLSITLILLAFFYGVQGNKPALIEGGTRGQTDTDIKDAKGAGF